MPLQAVNPTGSTTTESRKLGSTASSSSSSSSGTTNRNEKAVLIDLTTTPAGDDSHDPVIDLTNDDNDNYSSVCQEEDSSKLPPLTLRVVSDPAHQQRIPAVTFPSSAPCSTIKNEEEEKKKKKKCRPEEACRSSRGGGGGGGGEEERQDQVAVHRRRRMILQQKANGSPVTKKDAERLIKESLEVYFHQPDECSKMNMIRSFIRETARKGYRFVSPSIRDPSKFHIVPTTNEKVTDLVRTAFLSYKVAEPTRKDITITAQRYHKKPRCKSYIRLVKSRLNNFIQERDRSDKQAIEDLIRTTVNEAIRSGHRFLKYAAGRNSSAFFVLDKDVHYEEIATRVKQSFKAMAYYWQSHQSHKKRKRLAREDDDDNNSSSSSSECNDDGVEDDTNDEDETEEGGTSTVVPSRRCLHSRRSTRRAKINYCETANKLDQHDLKMMRKAKDLTAGSYINIFWDNYHASFPGKVLDFKEDDKGNRLKIRALYDNGQTEWIDVLDRQWDPVNDDDDEEEDDDDNATEGSNNRPCRYQRNSPTVRSTKASKPSDGVGDCPFQSKATNPETSQRPAVGKAEHPLKRSAEGRVIPVRVWRKASSSSPQSEENNNKERQCFVILSRNSTFAEARHEITVQLVPDLLQRGAKWFFVLPELGRMSTNQEAMIKVESLQQLQKSSAITIELMD